jgi:hypothetical protein
MTVLDVFADAEQPGFPLDADRMITHGDISAIGLLRHGTSKGKASVALVITTADGKQVLGQTTWALLRTAFAALNASPIVAEEVIDP